MVNKQLVDHWPTELSHRAKECYLKGKKYVRYFLYTKYYLGGYVTSNPLTEGWGAALSYFDLGGKWSKRTTVRAWSKQGKPVS